MKLVQFAEVWLQCYTGKVRGLMTRPAGVLVANNDNSVPELWFWNYSTVREVAVAAMSALAASFCQ